MELPKENLIIHTPTKEAWDKVREYFNIVDKLQENYWEGYREGTAINVYEINYARLIFYKEDLHFKKYTFLSYEEFLSIINKKDMKEFPKQWSIKLKEESKEFEDLISSGKIKSCWNGNSIRDYYDFDGVRLLFGDYPTPRFEVVTIEDVLKHYNTPKEENMQKIIGYKAPMDLFSTSNDSIKKGDLLIPYKINSTKYSSGQYVKKIIIQIVFILFLLNLLKLGKLYMKKVNGK